MTIDNIEEKEPSKEARERNDSIADLSSSVNAVENQGGITDPSDVQILGVTEDINDSDWDIGVCVYGPPVDIYDITDLDIHIDDDNFEITEEDGDEIGERIYGAPSNICLGRFVAISDDTEKEVNPYEIIDCVYGPPTDFNPIDFGDDADVDIFNPSED